MSTSKINWVIIIIIIIMSLFSEDYILSKIYESNIWSSITRTYPTLKCKHYIRGMFKNNVDFCYKKLSSQRRLIQTIPFHFGNRMGSENKIFILILFILLVHALFILPW